MMVKSKFFSIVLAFALIIPCLFILTACGGKNPKLKENEITITVADKVYDGTAIAVTATATSGATPTIRYRLASAAADNEASYFEQAPQNVGEYVVSAFVLEDKTYNAAADTKTFSITAKEVTLAWDETCCVNCVYDGQAKVPTVTAGNLVGEDVCAVNASVTANTSNINAGTFTFTATGLTNANYKLPTNVVSPEYTIAPKEISLNWQAASAVNGVYNGQAKVPTVSANGLVHGDQCAVNAAVTQGQNNVNVGTFTFTATGLTNANYKLPTNAVSPQYTISQNVLTNQTLNFEYNGQTTFEEDLSNLQQGLTFWVRFSSKDISATVADYKFKLNGVETTFYAIDENTCEANIVQKEVGLQWGTLAGNDAVYDGTAKVPTVTATGIVQGEVCNVNKVLTTGNDATNVTAEGFSYRATGLSGADCANYKLPENIVSGTYFIMPYIFTNEDLEFIYNKETEFSQDLGGGLSINVTFANANVGAEATNIVFKVGGQETPNYGYDEDTCTASIIPLVVGLSWIGPDSLVYNKQAKEPTVSATGLIAGDSCDVQKMLTDGKDNVNVTAEGFTFTANGLTNPNYALPQNVVSPEYEITPYILSGLHADDLEYSGSATFEVDLTPIEPDLEIVILFENPNVGNSTINIEDYWFTLNDESTENYDIDINTCSAAIVPREVELQWTAPTNLVFNAQAKLPTVTVGNLVGNEVCVVSSELTGGENNIGVGTFTFTTTGLTGADCANYVLPDPINCVSGLYEITGNSLVFGEQVSKNLSTIGDNWFTIPVGDAGGRFEILSSVNFQKLFVYSYDGTDFTEISLGKKYSTPYHYICFDGDADTIYYLKAVTTGYASESFTFTSHGHEVDDQCYCGFFRGTTLTVGTTETNISCSQGEVIKFRFYAQAGIQYYMTQTNLGANLSDYAISFGSQGDQSFEDDFGFGNSNSAEAPDDDWVYIYYTAPVAIANGQLTIHAL